MTTIISILMAISSFLFDTNSTPTQVNQSARIGNVGDVLITSRIGGTGDVLINSNKP